MCERSGSLKLNIPTDTLQQEGLRTTNGFNISESAVKKQASSIKSTLKLIKNLPIYVHGARELIEKGVDEEGRKFYKIYYKEES